ncbi:hypothetical protein HaLaN_20285 [Haematococcus lacustris]|uniref:Uncharacterized protein n=1 Tax=Haematococcus lacustris TaxID=44745 RepID=A0A699ZJG7_HAELA|nr:hypothetical protein HaLaN_20285 [Haematococcus lacustris]
MARKRASVTFADTVPASAELVSYIPERASQVAYTVPEALQAVQPGDHHELWLIQLPRMVPLDSLNGLELAWNATAGSAPCTLHGRCTEDHQAPDP